MTRILEQAAKIGLAQMKVHSFADRRPDRVAWADRQWEWASLRSENGFFDMPTYTDLDAQEKWFYRATFESPAMFRRTPGGGSLYWFGARDDKGAYLDGSQSYKLTVPHPVPASLFWSLTVYDPDTRSEIDSSQGKAALRSLFEIKPEITQLGNNTGTIDLYFDPSDAVFRNAREPRDLSRRLGGHHDPDGAALGSFGGYRRGRDHRLHVGAVPCRGGLQRGGQPRGQISGPAQ
jgi:hypothetical protein